jgi:hypothetical protein
VVFLVACTELEILVACVECGDEKNADQVGVINVLRAGHSRLACEVSDAVGRQQQEPTEATQARLNAALEHRRNRRSLGRRGCQVDSSFKI